MAYEKKVWENKPSKKTPITAEDLNHIEEGIFAVSEQSDQQVKNIQKNETDILNLKTKEEQNADQLANLTQQKADAIILTESGETIARTDTAESKLEGLTVFGHSNQKSYSGKNLLDLGRKTSSNSDKYEVGYTVTKDGLTATVLQDGGIQITGTKTTDGWTNIFYVTFAEPYTISPGTYTLGSKSNVLIQTEINNGTKNYANTFTTETEVTVTGYYITYQDPQTVNDVIYIMLNEGGNALPWEPYTGGVASPNPDYPQEVVSAGQKLANGAQLWDSESESAYDNGRRYVFQCKANTYYTLSTDITVASLAVLFDGFINENALAVKYNGNVVAFNSGQYTTLYLQIYNKDNPKDYNIMLNAGNTALPWEPYTGGVEKPYAVGIETRVYGKNLFDKEKASDINNWYINMHDIVGKGYYEMAIYVGKGNTVTVSYGKTLLPGNDLYVCVALKTTENTSLWLYHPSELIYTNKKITTTAIEDYLYLRFYRDHDLFMQLMGDDLQFECDTIATSYEPYLTPQLLPCATPNGLPGIQVTDASLANYTDSDGKMWACDYRDWERGVDVTRIAEYAFTGDEAFADYIAEYGSMSMYFSHAPGSLGICTHAVWGDFMVWWANENAIGFDASYFNVTSTEEFKTWLAECSNAGNPLKVLYVLHEPTETPIPEDELEAYRALHSNYPSTTIMNDAGCHMKAGMVADTKNYIDNKFAELQTALATTNAQLI